MEAGRDKRVSQLLHCRARRPIKVYIIDSSSPQLSNKHLSGIVVEFYVPNKPIKGAVKVNSDVGKNGASGKTEPKP